MSFSCKIVLSEYTKENGMRMVYLQAIIDRQRALVPLGFYIQPDSFDGRRQVVKPSHPNAKDYEAEMLNAVAKANTIASKFRQRDQLLTPEDFRNHFNDPTDRMDLIKFVESELEGKKNQIATNTHKQHVTVINKLKDFRKKGINFNHVTPELMQSFRNYLIEKGNGSATIEKIMKIVKHYLRDARVKGIAVKDFEMKIRTFKSHRNALTEEEVFRILQYYNKPDSPVNHKKVLRYFLFSCYTGLRISDINVITWASVHDNMLIYTPQKTKFKNEEVKVPLLPIDRKFLPAYTHDREKIFDTYAEPVTNRLLKEIASQCKIKKKLTYHTSRHTFGSLMAEGGDVVAIQRMMGHSDIKTTMGYVHTNEKQLIKAKQQRFGRAKIKDHEGNKGNGG
ncbi:MAG TPA: site-specific integrase [Ohtaekwangia sp.]